jgi:hypothetical protein
VGGQAQRAEGGVNATQDITFAITGQTLVWDAPEGRASSVTDVKVFPMTTGDDGTEEVATSGSASIDSVNTTFDAASGASSANTRKANLTATTNIVAQDPAFPGRYRQYLATDSQGRKEWLPVTGIVSADYVTTAFPMLLDYVATNTFVGTRLSITVDPTWVADTSNISDDTDPNPRYRALWIYVVGGVTYYHYSYFDLVRAMGEHSVTPGDMENFHPGWNDRLPTYHRDDQGWRLIQEAYQQVRWDLHQTGQPDETLRNREGVNELVKQQARVLLETSAGVSDVLAHYMRMYQSRFDQIVRVVHRLPTATDTSSGGNRVSAINIWSK